ncbi:hypothetical protein EON81_03295 [bacterium]|nr:MAG: hypothetical protein EON81_03295 [bacterium]
MPFLEPPKTELNVYISRDIAPSNKIQVQLSGKNVPRATITLTPIDPVSWAKRLGTKDEGKRPATTSAPVATWNASVASPGQKPNPNQADTYYSRQSNLPKVKPGIYLLAVTGGGKTAWATLNVTRLRVVTKQSPDRLVTWVTSLGGSVLSGAQIQAFRPGGGDPLKGQTGKEGLWSTKDGVGARVLLVRGPDGDIAAVKTGVDDPNGKLRGHVQLDRPIYRPGQRIFYRALLRRTLDQGYSLPKEKTALVEFRDAADNPIDRFTRPVTEFGAVEGSFDLPGEAMTGPYTVVIKTGDDQIYQTLSVAAYRKPEFKATITAPLRLLSGQEATVELKAETFFGTPVAGAEVRYEVRRSPRPFSVTDEAGRWFASGDGNLYASDTYGGEEFAANGSVQTDLKGTAIIKFPTAADQGDSVYTVTATVIDPTQRQVEASGSVNVDAADVRLGIASEKGYVNLGDLAPIGILIQGGDGKPRGGEVKISFIARDYDEKLGRWKERVVTETEVRVPASGKATAKIAAREAGSMIVRASVPDGKGRSAKAETSLYVSGNFGEKNQEKEDLAVDVRLAKARYASGETAEALITTNRPGQPMLITLEGRGLFEVRVLPRAPANYRWKIPISERLGPTATVSVGAWDGVSYVSGGKSLDIPLSSKAIKVDIAMDKPEYEPGDTARLTLTTRDSKGMPVPAEAGVSVVDSSIFAIAPDATVALGQTFWGPRPNLVATTVSAPEEVSGGAYQRVQSGVAPVRRRFEDTAYWNGMYQTGADGTAVATFEIPGNLTTWRAVAYATTKGTAVGKGTIDFKARRWATLRLAAPRSFTVGDKSEVFGTVDNRTSEAREFRVTLDGYGERIVKVPANGSAKTSWTVDAKTRGKVVLSGTLEATKGGAEFSDRLEMTVPVRGGLVVRAAEGGTMGREKTVPIPARKEVDLSTRHVKVEVTAGVAGAARAAAARVVAGRFYSVPQTADVLLVATDPKDIREALASLSRTKQNGGWGWFEEAPVDSAITAQVLSALAAKRQSLLGNQLEAARNVAVSRYNEEGVWERKALLAAALVDADAKEGKDRVDEVLQRGLGLSPYARLRLTEALLRLGRTPEARQRFEAIAKDAVVGDTSASFPVAEGPGWSTSTTAATAAALRIAVKLDHSLASKLALYLSQEADGDDAEIATALRAFAAGKPESRVGKVVVLLAGKEIALENSRIDGSARGEFDVPDAKDLTIRRDESGEAFYRVESRGEVGSWPEDQKIAILRRLEVLNGAGIWQELKGEVRPGQMVRVTLVVWGDGNPDALRAVSPIPAGFEVADAEEISDGRTDIRDGGVVWYLPNAESPRTLRVIMRAESPGEITLPPAEAAYLRRSDVLGATSGELLRVKP